MAVNPACNVSWNEHAHGDVRNFFGAVEQKKNQGNLEFLEKIKAMQRKKEVHYFWGDDSKYLGPESRLLKVTTLKAWVPV